MSGRDVVLWVEPIEPPKPIVGIAEPQFGASPTLGDLVVAYQVDHLSAFHKLRHAVRKNHATLLRRINSRHGDVPLSAITGRTIIGWHKEWSGNGTKLAMGHAFVSEIRTLFGFGFTLLSSEDCQRLCLAMGMMRFPERPARTDFLSIDQAEAVRQYAHYIGWHSIALAQAIQFELMLRQKDVIGEWVPESEPGESIIHWRGQKWLRGMWWNEIDENLIFRHMTSKRQKPIVVDLKLAPMIMDELTNYVRADQMHPRDPVICCEATGMPFSTAEFRRKWRVVADAVGVPRNVRNMDTRAGAITEAFDAGISGEMIKRTATHSDIHTTHRYNRGEHLTVASAVSTARVASRTAHANPLNADRGTHPSDLSGAA